MKAGQTKLEVNTKVVIKGVTDKDFKHLNGLTGYITHPFAFGETKKGWIGIFLDENVFGIDKINVKEREVKIFTN